jgi:hypothetical protein
MFETVTLEETRLAAAANAHPPAEEESMAALLRESFFGMNILSVAGFLLMGLALTMRRMARAGPLLAVGLMSAGTVLVLLGLFANRLPSF